MSERDVSLMKEAIDWAAKCNPVGLFIPKVGAILAVDGLVIGRGRRGAGLVGDDNRGRLIFASKSDGRISR